MARDELSVVFAALADPTRRDILHRLRARSLTVGELAASYAVSQSAISQHLRVLEKAGLIDRTARAQWRQCSIRDQGLDAASEWIARHRAE